MSLKQRIIKPVLSVPDHTVSMMQDTANQLNDIASGTDLNVRLCDVHHRINQACLQNQRAPESVKLLAVSKTRSADELRTLHALGLNSFGENYLAEARDKQEQLNDLTLEWHFIGPMQSNKTAAIAQAFDWVQSVDREKIIRRLAEQRPAELPPLNVLIQVNIDEEPQKSGCRPDEIVDLADSIAHQPRLRLRGLMAIPAVGSTTQTAYAFERMRHVFDRLTQHYASVDTLSMGMSDDLEAAIGYGSTMIRIGTALFGPRPTPKTDVA